MQAEKVHNDCKKGTQINILANKTKWCPNLIIKESKQTICDIYFVFSHYYVQIKLLIWSKIVFNGTFSFT